MLSHEERLMGINGEERERGNLPSHPFFCLCMCPTGGTLHLAGAPLRLNFAISVLSLQACVCKLNSSYVVFFSVYIFKPF